MLSKDDISSNCYEIISLSTGNFGMDKRAVTKKGSFSGLIHINFFHFFDA
jgi:hypothetical protein